HSKLSEAISAAGDRVARDPTAPLVNTDEAIPGTCMVVRDSIDGNRRLFPWSQFSVDSSGLVREAWQRDGKNSAILVLDKIVRVQWAKDGALTQQEVQQVIDLLHKLLNK
ncbi:hypothetical protein KZ870_39240, partial [Pseudomonas aeruginosa]|nr:hypothetical protein [Pseudomonas aeruginosa]